jgi:hypothetical protein|nr:MAG TPA: hypothetical protein [Bacteriophage sp.]
MKQITLNNFSSYIRSRIPEIKLKSDMLTFLVDMWHKYKYGEFLLKDVVYNYDDYFFLTSNVEDDRIISYTLEAYDIINDIKKIKYIEYKFISIERLLLEKKPQNQKEAYKLFIDELVLLLLMGTSGDDIRRQ